MEDNSNTPEEQKSNKTNEAAKPKSNKKIVRIIIYVVVVTGLGVAGFFGYRYVRNLNDKVQSSQSSVDELRNRVSAAEQLVSFNNTRVESLASTQANNYYNAPLQSFANVTVEKVLEDKNASLEDGFRFVILDIKLENKTSNDIYFSTSEFKLKDPDNYEYLTYDLSPITKDYIKKDAKVLLPDNRLPLNYAAIKPNETVKGSIVYVVNRAGTKFSLIRDGQILKSISL